jgi:hypothetical protein
MTDSFSFLGIDDRGWLAQRFEVDFSRFPYIGARNRLLKIQKEKSLARRVLEAIVRRVKLKSLLGYITERIIGWKPSQDSEPNKLVEDLIKVMDEESNKRTITRFLTDTQKRCKKRQRYFNAVSGWRSSSLAKADQSSLEDEMVVVSAQLVHRNAVSQYDGRMAQTAASLPGEWLLVDFPPHGMVAANSSFDGKMICLVMEKEFSIIFQQYLPFRTDIGWYPYCRVTGFFKEPGFGQSAPSLDVVMVEFRRPKPYQAEGSDYFSFLDGELKTPILLNNRSDVLLASYVLPLLAKGSSIENFKTTSNAERTTLQQYLALAGPDLPDALKGWYANT